MLSALAIPATATTYTVDVNGGADYEEIRPAMNAASNGDTVLVQPGTYTGELNTDLTPYNKDVVFLANSSDRAPVVIDCENSEHTRAFYLHYGQTDSTVISGFTIMNANNSSGGGGITVSTGHSATIVDCIFIDCYSNQSGGGIALFGSTATVRNCTFHGNSALYRGGALYTTQGSATIEGCLFYDNSCVQENDGGGAIYSSIASDRIEKCTVVGNGKDQVVLSSSTGAVVTNCVISHGTAGLGIDDGGASGTDEVTHCVLYANADGDSIGCAHHHNLFVDPLYCDDTVDDYTLCDDSLALEYNNGWSEQIGAFEAGCEPCGSPVEAATWGAVKALFR
jgi:predicted outer membrane repeat protein